MAKGGLAPPEGAELRNLARAYWARHKLRNIDEGGVARMVPGADFAVVFHGSHLATQIKWEPRCNGGMTGLESHSEGV